MIKITKNQNLSTFKTGGVVEEDGWYVCVPCGYKKYFKEGNLFTKCLKCLQGRKENFRKGMELWERMVKEKVE